MEKTYWEEFAKTGKVTDYLRYRGADRMTVPVSDKTNEMRERTKGKNR
jgi:hypothetical protein